MTVWRCEVAEVGQGALPAIDLVGHVVIGSGVEAQLRLPASVARTAHVTLDEGWLAHAQVEVDGIPKAAGTRGLVGAGVTLSFGAYRVRVVPAPPGTHASTPLRTESLARELVRSMLGGDSAPSLVIERGPGQGAKRALPPPEANVVIGRGDEAAWVIADADLSRTHAELRRGWDGTSLVDLGSKNGTRVDGASVRVSDRFLLHDGALIELGNVALRFHDPAERHLRGAAPVESVAREAPRPVRGVLTAAVAIALAAVVALIWVLAS